MSKYALDFDLFPSLEIRSYCRTGREDIFQPECSTWAELQGRNIYRDYLTTYSHFIKLVPSHPISLQYLIHSFLHVQMSDPVRELEIKSKQPRPSISQTVGLLRTDSDTVRVRIPIAAANTLRNRHDEHRQYEYMVFKVEQHEK